MEWSPKQLPGLPAEPLSSGASWLCALGGFWLLPALLSPSQGLGCGGLVALVSGRFGETNRLLEFQQQWGAAAESQDIVAELP